MSDNGEFTEHFGWLPRWWPVIVGAIGAAWFAIKKMIIAPRMELNHLSQSVDSLKDGLEANSAHLKDTNERLDRILEIAFNNLHMNGDGRGNRTHR